MARESRDCFQGKHAEAAHPFSSKTEVQTGAKGDHSTGEVGNFLASPGEQDWAKENMQPTRNICNGAQNLNVSHCTPQEPLQLGGGDSQPHSTKKSTSAQEFLEPNSTEGDAALPQVRPPGAQLNTVGPDWLQLRRVWSRNFSLPTQETLLLLGQNLGPSP